MAQRDLTNLRTVETVVADKTAAAIGVAAEIGENAARKEIQTQETELQARRKEKQQQADMFADIRRKNNEALISENLSKATLELNAIDDQYRIDFQKNPLAGSKEYTEKRQAIFDGMRESIDPVYRMEWDNLSRKTMLQNDAARQAWVMKQTQANTISSINTAMKNNLQQAYADGAKFGAGDDTDIRPFMNFGASFMELKRFGDRNLGENSTTELLENYGDNYVKQLVSGVAETNPLKALKLMDDEAVKSSFRDPEQFVKMRAAVESRAIKVEQINAQKEVLGILRGNAELFDRSKGGQIGYAELMDLMDRNGTSETAKSYLLKANGYKVEKPKEEKEPKLTAYEKADLKQKLYARAIDFGKREVTVSDLNDLQNDIFSAADKGALTVKEADEWTNSILVPFIEQKEKTIQTFSDEPIFQTNLGLEPLQEAFDESIAIKPAEGEELGTQATRENNLNRVRLYNAYLVAVGEAAKERGIEIGRIPLLADSVRRKIYADAQKFAIANYNAENYPELARQKDVPNVVIPKISAPSELQEVYAKGPNGKGDVSREKILEAARNKGISPDAVVKTLRDKGVIE